MRHFWPVNTPSLADMQQISLSKKTKKKNQKQHIEVIYGFDSKPQICNIAIKELAADYCCEETVKNWENPTRSNSVAAVRDKTMELWTPWYTHAWWILSHHNTGTSLFISTSSSLDTLTMHAQCFQIKAMWKYFGTRFWASMCPTVSVLWRKLHRLEC